MPSSEQILFLANHLLGYFFRTKQTHTPNSILIVKLDEIGDAICALPAINELAKQNPGAQIDILCNSYCNDIFKNIKGVHEVFNKPSEWNKKYDWVAELRGNWKTFWKSLRYRPQARFNRGSARLNNKGNQKHEVQTNFDIFASINLIDSGSRPWQNSIKNKDAIQNFTLNNNIQSFAVFHASARRELRKWKPESFKQISKYLWNKHQIKSIYIGVSSEFDQVEEITFGNDEFAFNATGKFNIPELAEVLKESKLFIGNESGPLQLADYLAIPSVSLFGPGVKDIFYPITPNSRVLHHVLDCNPCDQIHCVKEIPCINLIELSDVQIAIEEVLENLGKD